MYAKSPRGLRATWGPDGAPIRNPYREIMSIAYGFFSPLEGFMPWNEVESVLRERRLLSGWLFPFPIVFDVTEEELKSSGAKPGDDLLLTLKGRPFAVLKVEEVYKLPDRRELADAVFGTPERNGEVVKRRFDEKHPGWLVYRSLKPLAVAGKVTVVNPPRFRKPYVRFWTPPAASRRLIEAKGWKVVVAHQTRNVPHIGHEMLMKRAMFVAGGDRTGDAVLVNAVIGAKRPGDYVDEAILEGHGALALGGYFAGGGTGRPQVAPSARCRFATGGGWAGRSSVSATASTSRGTWQRWRYATTRPSSSPSPPPSSPCPGSASPPGSPTSGSS